MWQAQRLAKGKLANGALLPWRTCKGMHVCEVSEQQLWSWIDRDAPELDQHTAVCPACRARAEEIKAGIRAVTINAAPPPPMPERIGAYKIQRLLGEGGQALIYEAEQQSPRRRVALKVPRGGCCLSQRERLRFEREAQTLASLRHPGIATIYEAGRTEAGQPYFAMELVVGQRLDVYVREHELALRECLHLFTRICDALTYAHERGVVHRDLKPSNILIERDGAPKIVDFGLAHLSEASGPTDATVTCSGQIIGTVRYMSPEQARGDSQAVSTRSDVYALGVILHELLTGQLPCEKGEFVPLERGSNSSSVHQLGRRRRAAYGDLRKILQTTLDKEPAGRYTTARQLGDDLRRYLNFEPVLAHGRQPLYALRLKARQHRWAVMLGIGVLLAAALGLALEAWRERLELAHTRQAALEIQQQLEAGRVVRLVESAASLYGQHPEVAETALVWAQMQFRVGQKYGKEDLVDGAFSVLTHNLDRSPAPWALRALLAELYCVTGRSAWVDLAAQAEREAPETGEAYYLCSFATLDADVARGYAAKAVERAPAFRLAWDRLAKLSSVTHDVAGAFEAAEKMIALGGDRSQWTCFQGVALLNHGQYSRAIEYFTYSLNGGPAENVYAYNCRASAYLCLRRYEDAFADYSAALQCAKAAVPPFWCVYRRATPLWILGRRAEAAADYRQFRHDQARVSFAEARLVLLLREQGRVCRGQGALTEAAAAEAEAENVLAEALRGVVQSSPLEQVLKCLAGEVAPADLASAVAPGALKAACETCYYAGEVCLSQGELEKARELFQTCVDTKLPIDPDSFPDAMSEFHLALWRLEGLSEVAQRTSSCPP